MKAPLAIRSLHSEQPAWRRQGRRLEAGSVKLMFFKYRGKGFAIAGEKERLLSTHSSHPQHFPTSAVLDVSPGIRRAVSRPVPVAP